MEIPQFALYFAGGLISFLMGGNIYFIKRLVDRIDETAKLAQTIQIDVAVLRAKVDL